MPRRFDAVVFDWYATLGSPAGDDWWQQMFTMISDAGGDVPDHAMTKWTTPEIEHVVQSSSQEAYRDYEARLLTELLDASGLSADVQDELQVTILGLRERESIGIFPDVVTLLGVLRANEITVALCSNWSWDLDRHLLFNEIDHYFDVVICSAIVGYRKPHPEIFKALLDELSLEPARVAFVGDDWNADIEGATAAGLVPFHLARTGCSISPHDLAVCAADLDELRIHLLE
jgi:putative hydrolase of the HAD superfamily